METVMVDEVVAACDQFLRDIMHTSLVDCSKVQDFVLDVRSLLTRENEN